MAQWVWRLLKLSWNDFSLKAPPECAFGAIISTTTDNKCLFHVSERHHSRNHFFRVHFSGYSRDTAAQKLEIWFSQLLLLRGSVEECEKVLSRRQTVRMGENVERDRLLKPRFVDKTNSMESSIETANHQINIGCKIHSPAFAFHLPAKRREQRRDGKWKSGRNWKIVTFCAVDVVVLVVHLHNNILSISSLFQFSDK